jgi:hypothetical protein
MSGSSSWREGEGTGRVKTESGAGWEAHVEERFDRP